MSEYLRAAKEFCKKNNVKVTISFKDSVFNPWNDNRKSFQWWHNVYHVRIDRNHKTFSFNFTDSAENTRKNEKPSVYDVLACLQKYDVGTFEEFCSEFGYDVSSMESLKTYKAVVKEYKNVIRLFGDCMEELEEIN